MILGPSWPLFSKLCKRRLYILSILASTWDLRDTVKLQKEKKKNNLIQHSV